MAVMGGFGRQGPRLAVVLVLAGCGGGQPPPDDLRPRYAVGFFTADLSTGSPAASIRITYANADIPIDVVDMFAAKVRISAWPEGNMVGVTLATSTVPGGQLPNGSQMIAYGRIDVQLDPALPRDSWYGISIRDLPLDASWLDDGGLFAFADMSRGIRISPAHAPIVASVLWCAKGGTEAAVYVQFSEPVTGSAGAVGLGVGDANVACSPGAESATETQFICEGATGAPPFSVQIADTIVAQSSGTAMAATTVPSAEMQMFVRLDGCAVYKPVQVGGNSGP